MTVMFCGHRQIYHRDEVEPWLSQTIQKLIDEGADCFYLGNYGAFDRMAAWTLGTFKKKYPYTRIVLALAYRTQEYDAYLYDDVVYPIFDNKAENITSFAATSGWCGSLTRSSLTSCTAGAARPKHSITRAPKRGASSSTPKTCEPCHRAGSLL